MGDIIGLEEGLIWLPSHLLQEALFHSPNSDKVPPPIKRHQNHLYRFHHGGDFFRPTDFPAENIPLNRRLSGYRVQPNQKHRNNNWKKNRDEPMQAFFLASGPATSGTGVFFPTTTGSPNPNKKPPCASVLLPSRVVQALNLNVHSLGLQVSPRQDGGNGSRKKNRQSVDVNPITSPEMLLPKEWTY